MPVATYDDLSLVAGLAVVAAWLTGVWHALRVAAAVLPVAAVCALLPPIAGSPHPFLRERAVGRRARRRRARRLCAVRRRRGAGAGDDGAREATAARRARPATAAMPPLLTLERYMFRLVTVGFVLLTLTLASGMVFTEQLFGKPLTFTHKNVFSVPAGSPSRVLLLGRWRYGWRGRTALRWILAGTLLLVLGYLGSKFVLEGPAAGADGRIISAQVPLGRIPLDASLAVVLRDVSGFFSIAETAMMAVNRYRLKHRAQRGARGAKLALALLAQTDKLLGVILLGNNLVTPRAATLTASSPCACSAKANGRWRSERVAVTFLILVFSEITPKVVGAAHADRLAPLVSFVLAPMLRALQSDRLVRQPVRAGPAEGCFGSGRRASRARR